MSDTWWQGIVLWSLLFFPVWLPGCRRARKRMRRRPTGVRVSGNMSGIHVSQTADELEADLATWGVGPDWVQDRPYPELFEGDN